MGNCDLNVCTNESMIANLRIGHTMCLIYFVCCSIPRTDSYVFKVCYVVDK